MQRARSGRILVSNSIEATYRLACLASILQQPSISIWGVIGMLREKKILVLFEEGIIRGESLLYSIELARRLNLPIAVLMLVSDESKVFVAEDLLVRELMEPIERAQIGVSREIRYGDKATELLKYLASNSSPAAIVWGSDQKTVGRLGWRKPHHWLNKLAGLLPCSIVAPISKNRVIKQKLMEG